MENPVMFSLMLLTLCTIPNLSRAETRIHPLQECDMLKTEITWIELTIWQPNGETITEIVEGVFGNHTSDLQVKGSLHMVKDSHACNGSETLYSELRAPWIALVERGVCEFWIKASIVNYYGASGMIVYNHLPGKEIDSMTGIEDNITSVMITYEEGILLRNMVEAVNGSQEVTASMTRGMRHESAEAKYTTKSNAILLILSGIMCPSAIVLNIIALIGLIIYKDKPKPYLYLIGNLILTDLLVAVLGTIQIFLLLSTFLSREKMITKANTIYLPCVAEVLSDLWDIVIFSNLLTLFNLTCEHFIAFRWPLHHKVVVTKRRVLITVGLSWMIACIPTLISIIEGHITQEVPECYNNDFCYRRYYAREKNPHFSWAYSIVWLSMQSVVLLLMIFVYGYIISIIYRVSQRNQGFKKKRSAVITTLLLVLSFVLSYIFYYIHSIYNIAYQSHENPLTRSTKNTFDNICPACLLMLDFLFTGMIGAILDPIIYCTRMKEFKSMFQRFKFRKFNRSRSITSTSHYRTVLTEKHNSFELTEPLNENQH